MSHRNRSKQSAPAYSAAVDPFSLFRKANPTPAEAELAGAALRHVAGTDPVALALADRLLGGDAQAGRELARWLSVRLPEPMDGAARDPVATALWLAGRCGSDAFGERGPMTEANRNAAFAALIEAAALARHRLLEVQGEWRDWPLSSDDQERRVAAEQLSLRALAIARRRLDRAAQRLPWTSIAEKLVDRLRPPTPPNAPDDRPEASAPACEVSFAGQSRIVAPRLNDVLSRLPTADQRRFAWLKPLGAPMAETPVSTRSDGALDRLEAEMPNFSPAISRLRAELALRQASGTGALRLSPMLLVGPPGVGKTRFARRLAEELGLAFSYISLEGQADNRTLAGTASGWSTAEPSWPVREIARVGYANPLLMADEVDKCTASHNGDNLATLLGWLEPSTACATVDPVVGAPVDLSGVSWVLSANRVEGLPATLLSRLRVVEVGPLPPGALSAVLNAVLVDIARDLGLADPRLLPTLGQEELAWLRVRWKRTGSPRILRKLVERLLGEAARRPLAGPAN